MVQTCQPVVHNPGYHSTSLVIYPSQPSYTRSECSQCVVYSDLPRSILHSDGGLQIRGDRRPSMHYRSTYSSTPRAHENIVDQMLRNIYNALGNVLLFSTHYDSDPLPT